jgi:uncharacterized protein
MFNTPPITHNLLILLEFILSKTGLLSISCSNYSISDKYVGLYSQIKSIGYIVLSPNYFYEILYLTMRLTTQEKQIIKSSVKEVMGSQADVWLFGSRTDDTKRGGDIDLFIEADLHNPLDRVRKKSRLWAKLQQQLGEQRIDIILASAKPVEQRRIEQIAKESGVCL